jgi:methionyl-tRNA synthetase
MTPDHWDADPDPGVRCFECPAWLTDEDLRRGLTQCSSCYAASHCPECDARLSDHEREHAYCEACGSTWIDMEAVTR